MKKQVLIKGLSLFFCSVIVLSTFSCSHLYKGKVTKVYSTEDAEVYINGKYKGKSGDKIYTSPFTNLSLEMSKPGYKSRSEVLYPTKFNFGTFTSIFLSYFVILEGFGYHKVFPNKVKYELTKYPQLGSTPATINFQGIKLKDKDALVEVSKYKTSRYLKKKTPNKIEKNKVINDEDLSSGIYRMNNFLDDMGLEDTTKLRMSNYAKFSIYTTINNYSLDEIKVYRSGTMRTMKLDVNFKVLDLNGEEVFNKNVKSQSGHFFSKVPIDYPLCDALSYATIDLLKDSVFNELVTKNKRQESISYFKPNPQNEGSKLSPQHLIKDAHFMKLRKDEIRVVCLPVQEDGVLLVSNVVIDNSTDSLYVYDSDSIKYLAEIIQQYPGKELAYIKIDKKFERVYSIAKTEEKIATSTIYTIGYESYFNSLLVTRGVANAKRTYNHKIYYQLDASCSSQIYPISVNGKGQIIGVISKSLNSKSVGGISFSSALYEDYTK